MNRTLRAMNGNWYRILTPPSKQIERHDDDPHFKVWTRCCFVVCGSRSLAEMAPYPSGKGKASIAFCGGSNPSGAFEEPAFVGRIVDRE